MKNTGVIWCPTIPNSWNLEKVKHNFYISKVKASTSNPIVLKLARAGVQVRDISNNEGQLAASYDDYNPVTYGDLLLNPMDLYSGANCNTSEIEGVISPAYANLRKLKELNPKYYDYYFKLQYWTMAMFAHGKGVSFDNRWTINAEGILNYEIPVPTKAEQDIIVHTISSKCEQVDTLITNQEAQIEKLKQYKQSLITEVVTKGLNPNVEMKDSGVEWIGLIPKHWNVVKIKRIADRNHPYAIGDGDHGLIKPDDYKESGIPYIRVQNLGWATDIDTSNIVYISEDTNQKIKGSTLRPNDILLAKTGGTIGKTAIVPASMPISNTTSHVGKISVSDKYCANYIFYVLSSSVGYRQFWEYASSKTTRPELAIDELKQILITLPSQLEEQKEIVAYLDEECAKIDKLIEIKQSKISKLNEYKKSLIYEYVTGKKEVV